jgi:hypothetical protein
MRPRNISQGCSELLMHTYTISHSCHQHSVAAPIANLSVSSGFSRILLYIRHRFYLDRSRDFIRIAQFNSMYYYMICKKVTCTEIGISTHRLRTHSRRLIHVSSLATTGICNRELPWSSMVFQALMYIKTELLLS